MVESKNVIKVRDEFSFKYARENNLVLELSKILQNEIRGISK